MEWTWESVHGEVRVKERERGIKYIMNTKYKLRTKENETKVRQWSTK